MDHVSVAHLSLNHLAPAMKPVMHRLKLTRLMDQMRQGIRYLHYIVNTAKVDLYGIRFFIRCLC
jgi:hypothetical protein